VSAPIVHQPDSAAHVTEAHRLPQGWREVRMASVAWPVAVGPGGVFVIFPRDTAADFGRVAAWHGERRDAMSGAQLTASLVSQILSRDTGWDITCTPLVVIDDGAELTARPDLVTVLHRRRLTAWLAERPVVFDDHALHHVLHTIG
jgi:hypothetical protein